MSFVSALRLIPLQSDRLAIKVRVIVKASFVSVGGVGVAASRMDGGSTYRPFPVLFGEGDTYPNANEEGHHGGADCRCGQGLAGVKQRQPSS